MRFIDFLAIIIIFAMLLVSAYLLWLNIPTEAIEFKKYRAEINERLPSQSNQFYPQMRYTQLSIGYYISPNCSRKQTSDFEKATNILSEKTILQFHSALSEAAQIAVSCSNLAPEPTQKDHFVAGEGGPTLVINTTVYAIILEGKIALYRHETCDEPQIALHELLHALGFDHNSNSKSIMYPITNCAQELDDYIIQTINELYSVPSRGDLLIEEIDANKSGSYLSFEVTVSNYGLKKIDASTLALIVEGETIREFDVGEMDIGTKRHLSVKNLRIPRKTEKIFFKAKTLQEELSTENNIAEIALININ